MESELAIHLELHKSRIFIIYDEWAVCQLLLYSFQKEG